MAKIDAMQIRRLTQKTLLVLLLAVFVCCQERTEYEFKFRNPSLPVEERVDDLIERLTLREKAAQLLFNAPAIERLGIPEYNWWNECLHGLGRAGKATVFPQAIGMAAMFDREQMYKVATVISDEARAKYHDAINRDKHDRYQGLTFWTPNINIFRDPRWGRGMETYGEDPYLTGELAVPFIQGLQGNDPNYFKTIATAKHFVVHSGPEPERHSFNAVASERDFLDTYTPHFKKTILEANVQSIMCAYNRLNGEACCGSSYLLNEVLRQDWGFDGYVVSDCWGLIDFFNGHGLSSGKTDASALALKSGTDLNCGISFDSLLMALDKGMITENDLDRAFKRLFTDRFKLGMFDPDERVPFASIPIEVVASETHRKVALETTQKSMVLLKNDNMLPLDKSIKRIAVIGPNADDEEVLLANYNGHPVEAITPLEGIKRAVSADTEVIYAQGCDLAEGLPSFVTVPGQFLYQDQGLSNQGVKAYFYDTTYFQNAPVDSTVYSNIDINWWNDAPIDKLPEDGFGVVWTGYLVAPKSGTFHLGGDGFDNYRIYLDDELHVEFMHDDMNLKRYREVDFVKDKVYKIRIEYINTKRMAMMKLIWSPPNPYLMKEAIDAANQSDAVIMFMGLSPRLEGEEMDVTIEGFNGGDREHLELPKAQMDLMKALKKTGKPLILVLMNGSAVAINWASESIPAILEAWYPGQEAGTAIANILFGDYNPSGRLPVTFYKSVDQLPDFSNYAMKGRTYRYFEGEALFPFGYGLSYTSFEYENVKLAKEVITKGEYTSISFNVKNIGNYAGEEVIQLYVQDKASKVSRPIKELRQFKRVFLKPGESTTETFEITHEMLGYYKSTTEFHVSNGEYTILIGGSSRESDLLKNDLRVK